MSGQIMRAFEASGLRQSLTWKVMFTSELSPSNPHLTLFSP